MLYRMRVLAERVNGCRKFCARPVKPFERGRPWLRWTRALWKFNCGKTKPFTYRIERNPSNWDTQFAMRPVLVKGAVKVERNYF